MIIFLMNKTVNLYWFIAILSCICNLEDVISKEPISVHLNYKGKYSSDITNYEIVVPQRVNKDGSFISHLISHHHSKRSTKEMDFIFYKIPIEGKDYLIELTPNRQLISPGAVVEIHKRDVRKYVDRKFLNDSSNNETVGQMFRNLDIRKLENTECHFSGYVKGENTSKAALSTCYGLAGFIQITKGFYTIEPVAEHNPFVEDAYPHILYKADGLENSSVCHTIGELTSSLVDQVIRKRRESNIGLSLPVFIETLIVMDKTLINHHQDLDCENYVLTVFNMAFNLFHDASSGLMMTLTIVRIIRLEVENDEMNLRVNADAEKTLRYFQTWQYEINPGDDSHPNHHDIAVLITRVNVCYSPSSCGLLGLTTIGKACDPKLSAALCEDTGLRLGYVIAHEIGHLLGADHDSENSTCNGTDADGLKTVMQPHVSMTAQTWSTCSRAYFEAFFSSGIGNCLFDEPEEHHFNVQDLLPGVMYDADFQCKHLITLNARECDMGSTCDSLNCYVPGYACIITHAPPADGTHCGENMWCHDTKCLVVGERPGAVDGNWGEWSAWSDCSRTCGSGVTSATRNCDKPQPSHGGKNCVGERKRYKICAATVISSIDLIRFISEEVNVSFVGKPCETGRPSFRDIQCGEFDDWIYPEDGKVHSWKAYFSHDDNPCTLYCINEEKQVAALRPRVVDGTMCFRGIRDICVAGTCKTLPCDLHFESNAVEDACGVCHGDGTGCEFSEGIETFSKLPKGLTKLINVPTGTRNIKVEEMSPTLAKIVVRDKDTKDVYIRGKSLGMFNVPGSQAWLGLIKKNQEALYIPGPVTKPVAIWIQRLDNVSVKWSMALPAEQQRKPEFAWDFLKWGPCSAKCGPGTQKSEPSCMEEKAGLVEDSFCADLEVPATKVRQCEVAKCVARWMVGDWRGCEQPSSEKKVRKRVVYCIKPIGEGEGESQIVSESECTEPKPHESEPCEIRQKREDTEYNVDDSFFEPDSMFRSETSEFGFHKKYDDYLKHFAALSVPQRNSETIPLYLVSSPHFKHYFHVLETPEDSETSSSSDVDLTLPNGKSCDVQGQKKVSPEFYKETFSGQQIGVSHAHLVSQEGIASENRTKKSSKSNNSRRQKEHGTIFNFALKNIYKRSKSILNRNFEKNYSELYSDVRHRNRMPLRKNRENSVKEPRNIKLKFFRGKEFKRNFNYSSPNLTTVLEKLTDDEKTRFSNLINKSHSGELSTLERSKFRSCHWNEYNTKNTKSFPQKLGSFFSFFSKKSNEKSLKTAGCNAERRVPKSNLKEFDGSGVRKLALTGENFFEKAKNYGTQKLINDGKSCLANPFDPTCTGKFEQHSKKYLNHKLKASLADLIVEKQKENLGRKKKHLNRDKTGEPRLNKAKRSSRIWKKPKYKEPNSKTGKEQCGTETKNYFNNLFRDNHPKIFNAKPALSNKPQEFQRQYKKPIIKEGTLVIDRDLPENQEVDIIFEDDHPYEICKNYLRLPQPVQNKKKLTLKGHAVFNLFRELRRRSTEEPDETDRLNRESEKNVEMDINIPDINNKLEDESGKKRSKPDETLTKNSTESSKAPSTAKPARKPSETLEAKKPENSVLQCKTPQSPSIPEPPTENPSDSNSDYDIDEIILDDHILPMNKKKKKRKRTKKKKHKFKNNLTFDDQYSLKSTEKPLE